MAAFAAFAAVHSNDTTTNRVDFPLSPGEIIRTSQLPRRSSFLKARARFLKPNPNFMSEKTIAEKVKDIIVEQLGVNPEQVTEKASFIEDLGADSLDTVELVMAFEEEFSVEVPDEDAEKLQCVGDVVKYIEDKQNK